MKYILLFTFTLLAKSTFAQEPKTIDFINEAKKQDFSDLWTLKKSMYIFEKDTNIFERPEPLGYIGENFQRFYIHFISVIQNPENSLEYLVYGKTKVKNNICTFQGLITITKAQIYEVGDFPPLKQGWATGEYKFFEDPDQKETGIFKGTFVTNFYIDKNGKVQYDALMEVADGYNNNQFEGTWINYRKTITQKCNWGDFRIPNSEKLDSGTGEFIPTEAYLKYGWQSYIDMVLGNSDDKKTMDAIKLENSKWWIEKN